MKTVSERRFTVLRDTREKPTHGFRFNSSINCAGTKVATLKTGDYTIEGLEDVVCLERKESINEFAGNLTQKRFKDELIRMDAFAVAYVLLQFTMDDLVSWPRSSGLRGPRRKAIKARGPFLLKRLLELMTEHPTIKFLFVDDHGQEVALAILKKAWAEHGVAAERQP